MAPIAVGILIALGAIFGKLLVDSGGQYLGGTEVKRALLDQTLISGVGNIYADEALWRARLHGVRPTDRLTRAQGRAVLTAAVAEIQGQERPGQVAMVIRVRSWSAAKRAELSPARRP